MTSIDWQTNNPFRHSGEWSNVYRKAILQEVHSGFLVFVLKILVNKHEWKSKFEIINTWSDVNLWS